MALYIDLPYLHGKLGTAYVTDSEVQGIDLLQMIRDATDVIRSALKNSGYADVDTDDPATLVNNLPKLAVYAIVREDITSIPDCNIPLPENWDTSAAKLALKSILDGDADLTGWPRNTTNAVGGVLFTDDDAANPDGTPQFTSRENLGGF